MLEIVRNKLHTLARNNSGKSESHEDLPPFVIRGHHMPSFVELLYTAPSELAEREVAEEAELRHSEVEYHHFKVQDTIGPVSNTEQYKFNTERVYRDFIEAADDHPVEFVVGQVDRICGCCAKGEHCKRRMQSGTDMVRFDSSYIDKFLDVVRKEGIEYQEIEKRIAFTDSSFRERLFGIPVTNIRTNKGNAIEIFSVLNRQGIFPPRFD